MAPTPDAISSVQSCRLLSDTVPSIVPATLKKAPWVSGAKDTTGEPVSLGSRVNRVKLACPTDPSASTATASSWIWPGCVGVMVASPWALSGTTTPFSYSVIETMLASPAATGCTITGCPGTEAKLGVTLIRTLGAGSVSAARITMVSAVDSVPSETTKVGS